MNTRIFHKTPRPQQSRITSHLRLKSTQTSNETYFKILLFPLNKLTNSDWDDVPVSQCDHGYHSPVERIHVHLEQTGRSAIDFISPYFIRFKVVAFNFANDAKRASSEMRDNKQKTKKLNELHRNTLPKTVA